MELNRRWELTGGFTRLGLTVKRRLDLESDVTEFILSFENTLVLSRKDLSRNSMASKKLSSLQSRAVKRRPFSKNV
jgi:hypothetical protein